VVESSVLGRLFGPKRDEVTGGWRKVHSEFHNFYSSQDIIRMIIKEYVMGGARSMHKKNEIYLQILILKA
jgi:hypothetical protein